MTIKYSKDELIKLVLNDISNMGISSTQSVNIVVGYEYIEDKLNIYIAAKSDFDKR